MHSYIFTYDTELSRGGAHWARIKADTREQAERDFIILFPSAVVVLRVEKEY